MTLEQVIEIIERYKLRIPPTVYYELLADVREAEEEQEPTTKNNLGVSSGIEKNSKKLEKDFGELDCILRKAILDELEKWDWQELYLPIHFKQMLDELPSVTPQEPILDKLRAEITTLQNRCYALTKGVMCSFCKYECEYKADKEQEDEP